MEEKEYIKGGNLYNTNHKTTTQAYRDNYDDITWDDDPDNDDNSNNY